jgi:hypothetical protein
MPDNGPLSFSSIDLIPQIINSQVIGHGPGRTTGYFPWKCGVRFSRKAANPSTRSAEWL